MDEIKLFEGKKIRTRWVGGECFYAIVDVIEIFTESSNPRNYWSTLKKREKKKAGIELSTICVQLKMPSRDKKQYLTDCANKEGLLRIIQSVPSPKVEPFKRWLANVGNRVLDEKVNKRLAAHRKLKESQSRFKDNVKNRGVDDEGFDRVLKAGDKSLFKGTDIHEKYNIDKNEDADDYMHEYLLKGKDFATAMTHYNVHQADLEGEEEIIDEHIASNQEIRKTIQKGSNINPEDIPAQKDIKKLKKLNKGDETGMLE